MSKVIWVFKPVGYNPTDCIKHCKEQSDNKKTKFTFAGRLDPLAFGLMGIVSVGGKDLNAVKNKIQGGYKTYRFSVIVGLKTDSYDILGMVDTRDDKKMFSESTDKLINELKLEIEKIKKMKVQSYPPYSSKTVYSECHGKKVPLWLLAKEGKLPDEFPTREVDVKEFKLIDTVTINHVDLFKIIEKRINSLPKDSDFRQAQILVRWQTLLDVKKDFTVLHMEARISTGTYIRSICDDLGGVAYDIFRTSVGDKYLDNPGSHDMFKFMYDI